MPPGTGWLIAAGGDPAAGERVVQLQPAAAHAPARRRGSRTAPVHIDSGPAGDDHVRGAGLHLHGALITACRPEPHAAVELHSGDRTGSPASSAATRPSAGASIVG